MLYISFTLIYLNYFAKEKEDEHFKELLDRNVGDFMVDDNPFMMVFFYNLQSMALTWVTIYRLYENRVFFINYDKIHGKGALDSAEYVLQFG